MASYFEEQYIHTIEVRFKERTDMVKWLAERLYEVYQNEPAIDPCIGKLLTPDMWMILAEKAVKKNES